MSEETHKPLSDSSPEGPFARLTTTFCLGLYSLLLFGLFMIACVLPHYLDSNSLSSRLFYWVRILICIPAFSCFAIAVANGRKHALNEIRRRLIEAVFTVVAAGSLIAGIKQEESFEFKPDEIAMTVMVAVVLVCFSLVMSTTARMESETSKLGELQKELSSAVGEAKESQKSVQSLMGFAQRHLEAAREQEGQIGLLRMATNVLKLSEHALEDDLARDPIQAALGTMRTWLESGRQIYRSSGAAKRGDPGSPAEKAWWRSLTTYYNEERYDLARFEMITNSRNYTYVLAGVLDQLLAEARSAAKVPAPLDQPDEAPEKASDLAAVAAQKVIVVQATTFPPKDFYNFPDGPRGARTYHDLEFYGSYRRLLSLFNRQSGVFPHRILFMADPKTCGDEYPHEGSDPRHREELNKLEQRGWRLDTRDQLVWGSSHLFCAPYALPCAEDDKGMLSRLLRGGWTRDEAKVLSQSKQACPVKPHNSGSSIDRNKLERYMKRWRDAIMRLSGGTLNETSAREICELGPDGVQGLDVVVPFLHDREDEAWAKTIVAAKTQLESTADASLKSEIDKLRGRFDVLEKARSKLLTALDEGQAESADHLTMLYGHIQDLVPSAQRFDARCAELKSRITLPAPVTWESWAEIRSMRNLYQGPAETWLYHLLNLVDAALFQATLEPGRRLQPVWSQFGVDFLGGRKDPAASDTQLSWAGNQPLSRIRFVPVQVGQDDADPITAEVVPAAAFDLKEYAREFTMVGVSTSPGQDGVPFAGVEWKLLITCEIAPPYSTCRLDFYSDKNGQDLLKQHVSWVEAVWSRADFTKEIIADIDCELRHVSVARQPTSSS